MAITGIDEEGLPCDHIYAYKQCTSDRPAFTIRQQVQNLFFRMQLPTARLDPQKCLVLRGRVQ